MEGVRHVLGRLPHSIDNGSGRNAALPAFLI